MADDDLGPDRNAVIEIDDIAIVRVEQYYPFPKGEIEAAMKRYPNAQVAWAQEEPENMGAHRFIAPRIMDVLETLRGLTRIRYIGRKEAASPAAGYMKLHQREQAALVEEAMTLDAVETKQKKKA